MAKKETLQEVKIRLSESFDIRIALQEENLKLRNQLESKLDSVDMVSKLEYDGLIKQMEQIKLVADQYKRLYDEIEYKYSCLKNEHEGQSTLYRGGQNTIVAMESRIKELESQLAIQQDKHSRKGTGRKREVDISDDEIIRLRKQGKTVKAISHDTGLSTATINRILANSISNLV